MKEHERKGLISVVDILRHLAETNRDMPSKNPDMSDYGRGLFIGAHDAYEAAADRIESLIKCFEQSDKLDTG